MPKVNQRPVALVVEDTDWIRLGMVGRLAACGYEVAEARDAAEALPLAECLLPAVILTEEELPTYAQLTHLLAAHPTLRRVPVVIVNPDAEEGARHGDGIVLAAYELIGPLLAELNKRPDPDHENGYAEGHPAKG